ncbi:hypothetical protein GCM10008955_00610 [Deinococcus malanensis]|uniref:Adhesin domain-containing protein n=1 Tax=Deinococcus malanensis TaxID=1706855 RepID=A0ABQ2EKL7_9DEIO|nr:LiaF domain-containing protein [Deinococcus malanensis]GGK11218.1 hypothetical protein GCM10008955_00610 [Deinococcus malanensis]
MSSHQSARFVIAPLSLALVGGVVAAVTYRSVNLTLTHAAGDLHVSRQDSASPTLGARNVRVQNGSALVNAAHGAGTWRVGLSPKLPVNLTVRHEAGDISLNLRGLNVPSLSVQQTAGDVDVHLSAAPLSGSFALGQGDLVLALPAGVGLKLNARVGQGHVKFQGRPVDEGMNVAGVYQTSNYAAARTRINLTASLETGSVTVR